MKQITIVCCCCLLLFVAHSQSKYFHANNVESLQKKEKYWSAWVNDLYEMGVQITNHSIRMNEEAKKVVRDSNYRKIIYPELYCWPTTLWLLRNMELKKACWYMINLY